MAPHTDYTGARMLAERLVQSIRERVSHHGTPLEVVIGVAISPEDGEETAELARHAETQLYAARAAGLSVTPGR